MRMRFNNNLKDQIAWIFIHHSIWTLKIFQNRIVRTRINQVVLVFKSSLRTLLFGKWNSEKEEEQRWPLWWTEKNSKKMIPSGNNMALMFLVISKTATKTHKTMLKVVLEKIFLIVTLVKLNQSMKMRNKLRRKSLNRIKKSKNKERDKHNYSKSWMRVVTKKKQNLKLHLRDRVQTSHM